MTASYTFSGFTGGGVAVIAGSRVGLALSWVDDDTLSVGPDIAAVHTHVGTIETVVNTIWSYAKRHPSDLLARLRRASHDS